MDVWCYHCSSGEIPKIIPLTPKEQKTMEDGTWLVDGFYKKTLLKGLYPTILKLGYFCPICGYSAEPTTGEPKGI
jgi:hypothetical protein